MKYKEIETEQELLQVFKKNTKLKYYAFQNLDFSNVEGISSMTKVS